MRVRLTCAYDAEVLQGDLPPSDILLFPELVDGGYASLERGEGVHRSGDAYLDRFRSVSRRASCTCVAGTVALRNPRGNLTNSCLVFQRGRLVHRYDKIHLFRPAGDPKHFIPGTRTGPFVVLSANGRVRAGVVICYDLRFPELIRFLAREGVELLIVPARWPAVRDEAWQSLLKARAIENQMYVAGCNGRGDEGGASYVFDPSGVLVMSSRENPQAPWHTVDLDIDSLRAARARHNYLEDAVVLESLTVPRTFRRRAGHRKSPALRMHVARSRR